MSQTGPHLDLVPASCMLAAGRTLPEGHGDMINVGRLQSDMILILKNRKELVYSSYAAQWMNLQLNFKLLLIGSYKPMRPSRLPYNDILRQAGQWKSCLG